MTLYDLAWPCGFRLSRNESEKLRRDRLNAYIGELAKLVPLILNANRKVDKSSVLRLTVNYLRMYHGKLPAAIWRHDWIIERVV